MASITDYQCFSRLCETLNHEGKGTFRGFWGGYNVGMGGNRMSPFS